MFLYTLDGHNPVPIEDTLEWARWFERSIDERRVSYTTIGDVRISTTFLGVDHGTNDGAPILFETMIFGGPNDGFQRRYSTWDEAFMGHRRIVRNMYAGRDVQEDDDDDVEG